jgi:hypothetical protein
MQITKGKDPQWVRKEVMERLQARVWIMAEDY